VTEKQDHKARLEGHRERVSARGAGANIDSGIDSDDTQASLLREFDEADSGLKTAKKSCKMHKNVLRASRSPLSL
jgi:hypothetical protein